MRRLAAPVLALALWLAPFLAPAHAASCKTIHFQGNPYSLCEVTPKDGIRLWHSDKDGRLIGNFAQLENDLRALGKKLAFAMNGGMFHANRRPVGLYIEENRQMTPLADGGSYGNFGLKPNGVFCISPTALRVIKTDAYRANPPKCRFATQSGPMLVIDGRLHPRFLKNASSRHIRNGVGVSADGQHAVFAISDTPVTFYEFASLFRDRLHLQNALYLDGSVSRLYAPDLGRADVGLPLGPIIGLAVPAQNP